MAKDPAFLDERWYCINDFSHTVPNKGGVYSIFLYDMETKEKELMYIGMASNLLNRVTPKHEIIRTLNALRPMHKKIVITYVLEVCNPAGRHSPEKNLIAQLEKKLIKEQNPIINGA